jgi:putative Holliday junction resolvase
VKPWLGIDWGRARTGVAASDELGLLAHPVETVSAPSRAAVVERIKATAEKLSAGGIVVGLPLNMDGTEGESALAARAFAEDLGRATGLPVHFQDERLTSRSLAGVPLRKKGPGLDAAAACLILQGFLDAQRRGGSPT